MDSTARSVIHSTQGEAKLADEPTMRELAGQMRDLATLFDHKLTDARDDILDLTRRLDANALAQREQFRHYVLSEVYQADKATAAAREQLLASQLVRAEQTLNANLARIEDELTSTRRGNRTAFWASVGAVLAAMIGAVVTVMLAKGGH